MASRTIQPDPGTVPILRRVADGFAARPVIGAVLVAAMLFLLNPIGYVGGGYDDYRYLEAARCWVEQGGCVPTDHWARRWPLIAPTALVLRVAGESRAALMVVPLCYAVASVALLSALVTRRFGGRAGVLAGGLFAFTPLVSGTATDLGIDLAELTFVLAALLAADGAIARNDRIAPWIAGLAAGLAIQSRPTGLVVLPAVLALFWLAGRRRAVLPFLTAAALPSLAEALAYAVAAGDPLLGWRLSLGHGRIPSSELSPAVDTSRSPLLNPDFIAGWRRPMGIEVHWTIDGLLNYLADPAVALTLGATLVLAALEWRRFRARDAEGRTLIYAAALAAGWFGALTYGLAIDPKPRMFLVPLAAAVAVLAVLVTRRWAISRPLALAIVALIASKGVSAVLNRTTMAGTAAIAPAAIAAGGPDLAIDRRTAQSLALVPAAARLPLSRGARERRPVLLLGMDDCDQGIASEGYAGWRTVAAVASRVSEPGPAAALRRTGWFLNPYPRPLLCTIMPG